MEPKNLISVTVNKHKITALIDSGASVSCISRKFADKAGIKFAQNMNYELLRSADGRDLQVLGSADLTVGLRGLLVPYQFFVIDGLSYNVLLGIDFLQATGCKLDC